ncbi:Arylsulfatase [Rubripirellula lacrimiformis]|uniref:Arylsulfatase n=1 Tax=Rubripirellula lacrimiformis TaxID=1930273 RepID=A0A517NES5_9BACT|nr:sulfatase-like hydrolase/transferase [Rubripirellula lacrimiformis]QDT05637.1 Arylsulfatase [Rubripirellula lacrimiformis]
MVQITSLFPVAKHRAKWVRRIAGRKLHQAASIAILAIVWLQLCVPIRTTTAAQPNVVVIVADDLGWNAVGYHNADVQTPHLDQLCREGIELDNFYVSPMCSPTRAGLLTGRYPIRFGMARAVVPPWRDFGLPTDEATLADALGQAGYQRRGAFGKWHLGHARKKWLPLQRGFTHFTGCFNGAIDYFTLQRDGELDWHHGNDSAPAGTVTDQTYATTQIGDAATQFIRESAELESPFFCYVPFNAPHSPFQAPDDAVDQYRHIKNQNKRVYYAMITQMDKQIGRILKTIDDVGVRNNTMVWFLSDNGGVGSIPGNNRPLHGSKLTTFEGGVRAVACVRFPARYPGGRKISQRTAFIDVMPTVIAAADPIAPSTIAADRFNDKTLDGIDLNPIFAGTAKHLPARDLYFYHGQSGEDKEPIAAISPPWKLVVVGPNIAGTNIAGTAADAIASSSEHQISLFHIDDDPNETVNVADQNPAVVRSILNRMVTFRGLQPTHSIPRYSDDKQGFTPPDRWSVFRED